LKNAAFIPSAQTAEPSGTIRFCITARLESVRKIHFAKSTLRKTNALKGHGFSRAAKIAEINPALAAEGSFVSPQSFCPMPFSRAEKAPLQIGL
jgi:hypothetical protein